MDARRVFLSYGLRDDAPFVRRLADDLGRRGIAVWWDQRAMESRGQTFLQVIRDAITEECDRLVLVLGPEAVRSEYVRAEWRHALAACKVVLPVVRLGDRALPPEVEAAAGNLLPDELARFHAIDFRDDAAYPEALDALVRMLRSIERCAAPAAGLPFADALLVGRDPLLARLHEVLLADVERTVVIESARQTAALQGMGGIGKTALAAAFARACRTRRAFHDGIAWLTLGRSAPPLPILARRLGEALREPALATPGDDATWPRRLAEALQPRACLVVLDDVWEVEQAWPFVAAAAGSRSRILVTTRDAAVAQRLHAVACPVDLLGGDAARALFARRAGLDADALDATADRLIAECAGLPLALALVGAALHGRPPDRAPDLLAHLRGADLARLRIEFPEYGGYPHLLAALAASVDALAHGDAAAFLDLAVFDEDERIPEAALQRLWQCAPLDAAAVRERIDTMVQRSLLSRDDGGALLLHDLMHDFVRRRCPDRAAVAARLLAAYREPAGGDWLRVPDDGFIHRRLAALLARHDPAALDRLLDAEAPGGGPGWHALRSASGQLAGFLDDLRCAESSAAERARASVQAGCAVPLARLVQCALTRASLASIGAGWPPALWAASVREGRRDPRHALDAARALPQLEAGALYRKCEVVHALASAVPDALAADAFAVGLDAIEAAIARGEIAPTWIAGPLGLLARVAPDALLCRAFELAERLGTDGGGDRAMGPLAVRALELGEETLAATAAARVTLDSGPAFVLREMALVAGAAQLAELRARWSAWTDARWRAIALDGVAIATARDAGPQAALDLIATFPPDAYRIDALAATAPWLDAAAARAALPLCAAAPALLARSLAAMAALAARLPPDEAERHIEGLWQTAYAGHSSEHRHARRALVKQSDPARWRADRVRWLLDSAPDFEDGDADRALAGALVLRGETAPLLGWIDSELGDGTGWAAGGLIAAAASQADGSLLAALASRARNIRDERQREITQAALLSRRAALGRAEGAWQEAVALRDPYAREQAVSSVCRWVRGAALDDALRRLGRIDDSGPQARWLEAVATAAQRDGFALAAAFLEGRLRESQLAGQMAAFVELQSPQHRAAKAEELLDVFRVVPSPSLLITHAELFGHGDGTAIRATLAAIGSARELRQLSRELSRHLPALAAVDCEAERQRLAPWAREHFETQWQEPGNAVQLRRAAVLHAFCSGLAAIEPALADSVADEGPLERRLPGLLALLPLMPPDRRQAAEHELLGIVERSADPAATSIRAGGLHDLPAALYAAFKRLIELRAEPDGLRGETADLACCAARLGDVAFAEATAERLHLDSPRLAIQIWLALHATGGPDAGRALHRAVKAAVRVQNAVNGADERSDILARLAAPLIALPPADAVPLLAEMCQALANAPRPALLRDLAALAPVFVRLAGAGDVMPLREATARVVRWWP